MLLSLCFTSNMAKLRCIGGEEAKKILTYALTCRGDISYSPDRRRKAHVADMAPCALPEAAPEQTEVSPPRPRLPASSSLLPQGSWGRQWGSTAWFPRGW